jgi:type IV secretory pathway VirB6-like protein
MDSFGINSIKSCGVYLDIETISNKKYLNYKVIDLVEYYNFNLKFIFIEHHMRKLQSFFATY